MNTSKKACIMKQLAFSSFSLNNKDMMTREGHTEGLNEEQRTRTFSAMIGSTFLRADDFGRTLHESRIPLLARRPSTTSLTQPAHVQSHIRTASPHQRISTSNCHYSVKWLQHTKPNETPKTKMMQRLLSATTVLLSLDSSLAFSTAARRSVITTQPRLMKPLQVGFVLDGDMRRPYYSQEEAYSLMELAYDCASDDSCSIEEADSYLNTIMYVQSDCTSGELVGKDLCENQDHVAEVVAQLRAKIAKANRGVIHHSMKHGGWTASKQLAGLTLVAGLVMMITALQGVLSWSTATSGNSPLDASPFTTQEWWWAMRDGYLPTMVESYIRNGGLASVASDIDVGGSNGMVNAAAAANVVPFTLQEWGWAMQGGYLPRMMAEQFQQGGFVMDAATSMASSAASSSSQDMATVSLTPQEWMWAAQGGYLDTLVGHVARNGGLATGADVESATPFTVQEWQMAMQGGYLNTMMEHYIRNGGL